MPTELRTPSTKLSLLARHHGVPGIVDERLVQQAVDDARVHPVSLAQARLEMPGDMLNVTLSCGMQGRAEATGPILALAQESDDLFSVGTRLAAVALLVMLIERVGAPEAAVAARLGAGILPPALVELVFVTLPVVLALETCLTRGAPVDVRLVG